MAGDRRATMGNLIANRDIEKVFPPTSTPLRRHRRDGRPRRRAGQALPGRARALREDRGHDQLSLDGKANRLATMIRGNLGMAMQGLAVVPMFAGLRRSRAAGGRIFSYDVTGGCYEEHATTASAPGRSSPADALKKLWRPGLSEADEAVRACLEASTTPPTTTPPPADRTSGGGSGRPWRSLDETGRALPQ
jgi:proteasome beta subunit